LELASSTRGASAWVLNTPTGLPDWISSDSSSLSSERCQDLVEALPVARGAADAAVDHQVLRAFGHVGVEVVLDHAVGGLGQPVLAVQLAAARARITRVGSWRGSVARVRMASWAFMARAP
jgi:hypothetical protein